MRVLVLGAGGFLGRRTMAALAASGWAMPIAGVRRRSATQAEQVVVDATNPGQVARALERADAVVNMVAGSPTVIVDGARALFDAAPAATPIVHLSSMAVYGDASGRVDEAAPITDTGGYAGAKVAAERMAREREGVLILRPGCIYGGGSPQWSRRIAELLRARRIGDLGADGDGCSNLVHVDDVVALILAQLRTWTGSRVFNLAMPEPPDWNTYFLAFARALGETPIVAVPPWRLRAETIAAVPLRIAERAHLPVPASIPPSLARLWRQDIRLDTTAVRAAFPEIAWTSLAVGVAEAAVSVSDRVRTA